MADHLQTIGVLGFLMVATIIFLRMNRTLFGVLGRLRDLDRRVDDIGQLTAAIGLEQLENARGNGHALDEGGQQPKRSKRHLRMYLGGGILVVLASLGGKARDIWRQRPRVVTALTVATTATAALMYLGPPEREGQQPGAEDDQEQPPAPVPTVTVTRTSTLSPPPTSTSSAPETPEAATPNTTPTPSPEPTTAPVPSGASEPAADPGPTSADPGDGEPTDDGAPGRGTGTAPPPGLDGGEEEDGEEDGDRDPQPQGGICTSATAAPLVEARACLLP